MPVPRSNPDTGLDHQDPITVPTWTEFDALEQRVKAVEGGTSVEPPIDPPDPPPTTVSLHYGTSATGPTALLAGAQIEDATTIYVSALVGPLDTNNDPPVNADSAKFYLNTVLDTTDAAYPFNMDSYAVASAGDTDTVRVDILSSDGITVVATATASYLVTATSPPAGDSIRIGSAVAFDGIGPPYAAPSNGPRVAFPFVAPQDGVVDDIAFYFICASTPNYYGGDGGHNRVGVFDDNAGAPNMASQVGVTVDLGDGPVPGTCNPSGFGASLGFYGNFGATVTKGTQYWFVVENIDAGGWIGLDAGTDLVVPTSGFTGSRVWKETGSGTDTFALWAVGDGQAVGDGYIMLYNARYNTGKGFGHRYEQGGPFRFGGYIGSGKKARETFTVSSLPVTVSSVSIMVWGGSGNLTLTMNGTSKTINHSGKGWATFSPFSTVLSVGSHSWDLSSAGSHLLGPNKGWGGWDAPDGQAWLYNGTSWGYWPGWSAPDQLMTHQWYLDGETI